MSPLEEIRLRVERLPIWASSDLAFGQGCQTHVRMNEIRYVLELVILALEDLDHRVGEKAAPAVD